MYLEYGIYACSLPSMAAFIRADRCSRVIGMDFFFGEKGLGEKPQGIHLHLKIKFLIFALHTTISAIAYTGATIAVSVAAAHRTVDEGHADIGDAEVALMAVSAAYAAVYFTGRIVGLVR